MDARTQIKVTASAIVPHRSWFGQSYLVPLDDANGYNIQWKGGLVGEMTNMEPWGNALHSNGKNGGTMVDGLGSIAAPNVAIPSLPLGSSTFQALQIIEDTGAEIALIVDGLVLKGVLTDGDIRRSILTGVPLDGPVDAIMQKTFTAVPPETGRSEALDLMRAHNIRQLPILSEGGRLVGLHQLHDLIGVTVRPNPALIFCGGRGSRLLPLTERYPKPMLPVAGRPILERILLHLIGYGFRHFYLAVHFMAEIIEEHFGDGSRFGCTITYLHEETPLGTGGALGLLPRSLEGPILAMNGDLVTQFDAATLLEQHTAAGNRITVGTKNYCQEIPFGVLTVEGGRVTEIQEKPLISHLVNAGIYVLDSDLRHRIPQGMATTIPNLMVECLERNEKVGHCPLSEDWIDVGRPLELKQAMGLL